VVAEVTSTLAANGTRTVLIGAETGTLEQLGAVQVLALSDPRWVGMAWRAVQHGEVAGVWAEGGRGLARSVREVALRLRLAKLVWLDAEGGLRREGGGRLSHIDRASLSRVLAETHARADLLHEIGEMVDGGLPSVAICTSESLADELFTYAGAGTLFTRNRYIDVRSLALDEFDQAQDLIARGVAEGYLVARNEAQVDAVLANAFGVFVEARYLAGIGALIPHAGARAGELGSLYTLTRFAGGGVGSHLVAHACAEATRRGLVYVYACTTEPRVARFFEANGFGRVGHDAIPAEKWRGYPASRRAAVACFRRNL